MISDQLTAYAEVISDWFDTLHLGIQFVIGYVWSDIKKSMNTVNQLIEEIQFRIWQCVSAGH